MSKGSLRASEHVYDFILRFYPKRYREEFGEEMKYVFSESLKDAYAENSEQGVVMLWARTFLDTGKSLFIQHFDEQKGGGLMKAKNNDIIMQNKIFLWIAVVTGLILLLPLLAMQFSNEVDWKLNDFIIMGILLFGTGSLFVLVARIAPKKYRALLGVGFALALLLIWAHLAVGLVDTWPLAGS